MPRNVEKVLPVQPGAERRSAPRIDLEVEIGFETENNFYTGLTQDISTGGVFVATHNIRPRGERISLKFTLPGATTPFVVEAEVRWIREVSSLSGGRQDYSSGMGFKFINLQPQVKAVIASFLKQRDSIFYDDE